MFLVVPVCPEGAKGAISYDEMLPDLHVPLHSYPPKCIKGQRRGEGAGVLPQTERLSYYSVEQDEFFIFSGDIRGI